MENAEDISATVELYIYDLSKGMASMMSGIVVGKLMYTWTEIRFTLFKDTLLCIPLLHMYVRSKQQQPDIFKS